MKFTNYGIPSGLGIFDYNSKIHNSAKFNGITHKNMYGDSIKNKQIGGSLNNLNSCETVFYIIDHKLPTVYENNQNEMSEEEADEMMNADEADMDEEEKDEMEDKDEMKEGEHADENEDADEEDAALVPKPPNTGFDAAPNAGFDFAPNVGVDSAAKPPNAGFASASARASTKLKAA